MVEEDDMSSRTPSVVYPEGVPVPLNNFMRESTEPVQVWSMECFQGILSYGDEEMEDADQEEKMYTMRDVYGTPTDSENEWHDEEPSHVLFGRPIDYSEDEAEAGSDQEEQDRFRALEADFSQAQKED
jgi:hypothetical protein